MHYTINRITTLAPPDANWDRPEWQSAETLEVGLFPWKDSGHRPRVAARLLYNDEFLAIIWRVEDRYVRAVAQNFQDSVCRDSCAEFFVSPLPDSDAYFNFEVNCGGTMLVRRCPGQSERESGMESIEVSAAEGAAIPMAHSLPKIIDPEITEPTIWTLEYHLQFALFENYFSVPRPSAGTAWKANFYKCGDATSHPHWGSWAPVDTPSPSFHQPAFFQPIIFGT